MIEIVIRIEERGSECAGVGRANMLARVKKINPTPLEEMISRELAAAFKERFESLAKSAGVLGVRIVSRDI